MDRLRTKRPIYILFGVCLLLTAVSLFLILWVRNNTQAATRLIAAGLTADGSGYALMANEAEETFVLGDYTTRVSSDGVTLMSARGEERAYYELGMRTPYVLRDNDMLVVGSAEGGEVFVLDQEGTHYRLSINGTVSSAYSRDNRLLIIAARPGSPSVLTEIDLLANEAKVLYEFSAGNEPMRARYTPNGEAVDVLVQPVYAGESGAFLLRLNEIGGTISETKIAVDDLFADFTYAPDGRIAVLGAASVWLTGASADAAGTHYDLPGASGFWIADGRLIALAGSETGGYALYELGAAATPLISLESRPVIMPAVSDTYAVIAAGDTLRLYDMRGAREIISLPLTQTVHRIEFTGPTSFLVIADNGVYPYAVQ